jgi:predicted nucleic acid-binding protein
MDVVFADTVYWQAYIDFRDDLHNVAVKLTKDLKSSHVRYVTSEMVLTEVLNALGGTERGRQLAVDLVRNLKADANVEIVSNVNYPFERKLSFRYYV